MTQQIYEMLIDAVTQIWATIPEPPESATELHVHAYWVDGPAMEEAGKPPRKNEPKKQIKVVSTPAGGATVKLKKE